MRNKSVIFILTTALAIGLLAGCGSGVVDKTNGSSGTPKATAPKQNDIAASFLPRIEIIEQGTGINVNYRVKNISGKAQKLTFSNGLQVDYIVYDESGKKLKQYSEEVMSTQAMEEVNLENNEEISKEFTITDLKNGKYKLEVFLTAKEEQASVVKDLLVEKAAFNGSGKYVGQIDPHTIEIDMNGTNTAFQLSDEAQRQLLALKEGSNVTFLYKENENGQKVIEKFL
ncbi:BsuPI-related putative proteinase inhibitor [Neobacillus sp. 114]|uniref:BsuPI-related putative proteinase inhibitor n=1 Tax=Neobacillus sp. 114 TaxID=3048535 RepID=UPI0024C46B53|nr:BsuPI-related putative proteinase inhibitor [Neobacillus sp. 114]